MTWADEAAERILDEYMRDHKMSADDAVKKAIRAAITEAATVAGAHYGPEAYARIRALMEEPRG